VIFIVVKFPVRPDRADEWPNLVAEFTAATRAEPGNIFFEWSRSLDDPNEYVLVEAFQEGEAAGRHVNSEHFKAAMASLPAAISATPPDRERAGARRGLVGDGRTPTQRTSLAVLPMDVRYGVALTGLLGLARTDLFGPGAETARSDR
jgi:quinol monooxygenase YgiN